MSKSRFAVEMVGYQDPPAAAGAQGGYSGQMSRTDRYVLANIENGPDDEKIECIVQYAGQIAAGATVSIDFKTQVDRFGVAANALSIKAGIIRNTRSVLGSTGTLRVKANAANGWDTLIKAVGGSGGPVGAIDIPHTGGIAFWCFRNGALVVDATHKVLDLTESGGAQAVEVVAQFWCER